MPQVVPAGRGDPDGLRPVAARRADAGPQLRVALQPGDGQRAGGTSDEPDHAGTDPRRRECDSRGPGALGGTCGNPRGAVVTGIGDGSPAEAIEHHRRVGKGAGSGAHQNLREPGQAGRLLEGDHGIGGPVHARQQEVAVGVLDRTTHVDVDRGDDGVVPLTAGPSVEDQRIVEDGGVAGPVHEDRVGPPLAGDDHGGGPPGSVVRSEGSDDPDHAAFAHRFVVLLSPRDDGVSARVDRDPVVVDEGPLGLRGKGEVDERLPGAVRPAARRQPAVTLRLPDDDRDPAPTVARRDRVEPSGDLERVAPAPVLLSARGVDVASARPDRRAHAVSVRRELLRGDPVRAGRLDDLEGTHLHALRGRRGRRGLDGQGVGGIGRMGRYGPESGADEQGEGKGTRGERGHDDLLPSSSSYRRQAARGRRSRP